MKLHTKKHPLLLAVVLAVLAVAGLIRTFSATASPARQPLAMPVADVLPAFTCLEDVPGERTCELWAREGSLDLPDGGTAPIWGFANRLPDPASFPGPALIVNQGDIVNVVFHNEIPGENISLAFTGQELYPDLTGIATGETVTLYVYGRFPRNLQIRSRPYTQRRTPGSHGAWRWADCTPRHA